MTKYNEQLEGKQQRLLITIDQKKHITSPKMHKNSNFQNF